MRNLILLIFLPLCLYSFGQDSIPKTTNQKIETASKLIQEADKKAKLDALIGGNKKLEGNTNSGNGTHNPPTGNQGAVNRPIYSNSYYGREYSSGNGAWGLNGRRLSSPGAVKAECNDEGTVVVEVKVNKNGGVTNVKYSPSGSNTTSTCLKDAAI